MNRRDHPTTRDLERLLAAAGPGQEVLALLPVGCTEQHGPFLPVETDTLVAEAMAASLARRLEAAGELARILPAIAYSPTRSNASFAGTVSVEEQPFRAYTGCIVQSLLGAGAVVLVSGHGPADPSLRELAFAAVDGQFRRREPAPKPVLLLSIADACDALRDRFADPPGRHADWREFLLVHQVLGPAFFTPERLQAMRAFGDAHEFRTESWPPGIPMEYRSVQGVVGSPLPGSEEPPAELADRLWTLVLDRLFDDLQAARARFAEAVRRSRIEAPHGD